MNDQELWEHIQRGDAVAFDGFYRENAPRVQAFLRQLLVSRQPERLGDLLMSN